MFLSVPARGVLIVFHICEATNIPERRDRTHDIRHTSARLQRLRCSSVAQLTDIFLESIWPEKIWLTSLMVMHAVSSSDSENINCRKCVCVCVSVCVCVCACACVCVCEYVVCIVLITTMDLCDRTQSSCLSAGELFVDTVSQCLDLMTRENRLRRLRQFFYDINKRLLNLEIGQKWNPQSCLSKNENQKY